MKKKESFTIVIVPFRGEFVARLSLGGENFDLVYAFELLCAVQQLLDRVFHLTRAGRDRDRRLTAHGDA